MRTLTLFRSDLLSYQPETKGARVPQSYYAPAEYAHIHPALERELSQLPTAPEGHISPEQGEFLFYFVRLIRAQFVVETGFCVGHSACIVMLAQQSVGIEPQMLSIDICRYDETKQAAQKLKARFPGLKFVEGDTKDVLSSAVRRHLRRNEHLRLDLGMIDGGHDMQTALHDFEILLSYLRPGGHLWPDDFEKRLPNSGRNLAGHTFARRWGNCMRFAPSEARGFLLHQKSF